MHRQPNLPPNRHPQPNKNEVQLLGTVVALGGVKADYHANAYAQKMQKCPLDAGMDLFPARVDPEVVALSGSWTMVIVPTLLHVIIGPGVVGWILPRGSSATRLAGAEIIPSTIDPHYSGELVVRVKVLNQDFEEFMVKLVNLKTKEIALAQIVFVQCLKPVFAKWDDKMAVTLTRGSKGFGSTDITT